MQTRLQGTLLPVGGGVEELCLMTDQITVIGQNNYDLLKTLDT
jgi:hypothetical protein